MLFILFFSWAFQIQLALVFQPVYNAYYTAAWHWKKRILFLKKKKIKCSVANDTNAHIKCNSRVEVINLFGMQQKFEQII